MKFLSLATSDILFTCRGLSLPRMGTRAFPTNFLCKLYHQRQHRALKCLYTLFTVYTRAFPTNFFCNRYHQRSEMEVAPRYKLLVHSLHCLHSAMHVVHSLPTSSAKNTDFQILAKLSAPRTKRNFSGKRNSGVEMTLCQYTSYHFPLFRILQKRLPFYLLLYFLFLLDIFSTKQPMR